MAGIVFDITFIPGASAIGAFLEYRPVHPGGPASPIQYPWVTNTNIGNVLGYFPITSNPMVLNDVPGVVPDFQENTVYEFRIKQVCADGTELYSDVDGDYWVPNCDPFISGINQFIPIQQGPFGVDVTLKYRAGSSITSYIINISGPSGIVGTTTIPYTAMDTVGGTPYTFTFTNDNLIPPNQFQALVDYAVSVTTVLQTNTGTVQITNCNVGFVKGIGCTSWDIYFGDNWGLRWYDCGGNYHECFSNVPYSTAPRPDPLRICSPGQPQTFYCSGNTFVDGVVVDPITGLPTLGGLIVLAANQQCLPGYDDFDSGTLLYPNGAPVTCVTTGPCFGTTTVTIVGRCMPTSNLDVTTYRNGDPIPYVDDPAVWNTLTTGAWCWPGFDPANAAFGKLYNWYAANDPRNIAPVGYRVPTQTEWSSWTLDVLFNAGYTPADLRETGALYWDNNGNATNILGFNARGGGRILTSPISAIPFEFKQTATFWLKLEPSDTDLRTFFINSVLPPGYGYTVFQLNDDAAKRQGRGIRLFCGN